ncbi:MAG: putative dehypoxanthinylfutalosine cyclase [Pseudomonadota bacterium]
MDRMREIEHKVENRIRLDESDAQFLFESPDLMRIGALADRVNRRKNDDRIFFNINRHINPTNICALSCKFCAFSRKPGEEGGYAYEIPEMVEKARAAVTQGATELHMVGGLHPRWPFNRYLDMIATLHREFPGVHLKAFTAVELDWMARKERRTIAEIMADLKEAGLGSLPGGGAEIFHPEIRDQICDTKVSAEQWIETHRTAHKMGLRSNCTMLYGHIERFEHRVDHMRRLRDLQDETGGFNVFIPLAFQPYQNDMGIGRYTFGYDDLKTIAVSRLYLDNFANIKAYWVMMGQDVAQLGLNFGANDFDGTVTEEKISRMAGGRAGMVMTRDDLEQLILRAGRTPVERDTLYRPIDLEQSLARATAMRAQEGNVGPTVLPASKATSLSFTTGKRLTLDELRTKYKNPQASENGEVVAQAALLVNLDPCNGIDAKSELPVWQEILAVLSSAQIPAGTHLHLAGLTTLANAMDDAGISLATGFQALLERGVTAIEETSLDSTNRDIRTLHKAAHAADIRTAGRVVLRANGKRPDWKDFDAQLKEISEGMRPLGMTAVRLETIPSAVITAHEYMQALQKLRSAAGTSATLIAPVMDHVPTLAPAMGLGSDGTQHPAQKLIPLLADHGADDLGIVDPDKIKITRLIEDIRSAGLSAANCQSLATLDLRHKPADRMVH